MVKQVIKENAEAALANMAMMSDTMNLPMRCVHLPALIKNSNQGDIWAEDTMKALAEKIKADQLDAVLYVCADGDVFVLSRQSVINIYKWATGDIQNDVWRSTARAMTQIYEFPAQAKTVVKLCEEKIESRRKDQAAREEEEAAANAAKSKDLEQSIDLDIIMNTKLIATLESRRLERKAPGILVVEDDPFSLRLVGNALRNIGEVYNATTGREAVQSLIRHAPDMILLDIGLPDVMGIQVLDELLTIDPSAYVVMLSGNGSKDNVVRAMRKGAKGFIAKPFTIEKLTEALQKCPHIAAKQQKRIKANG